MSNSDKSLKDIIDSRLSDMTLGKDFVSKINSQAQRNETGHKRAWIIAAALSLCLIISIPVMAVVVPGFNRVLSLVSPEVGQMLQPIELTSESNGIKMEVVAAINDNDTTIAYLTFQDLTGDRVDETIDLYDYVITGANMFTSEVIDYNEQTKTATIRMVGNGGDKLDGKKITLRVDSFLSGKHTYHEAKMSIDLLSLLKNHKHTTVPFDVSRGINGGGTLLKELQQKGKIEILKTNEMNMPISNIKFAHISNMGVIDGQLHIQTKWKESIDNHGFLFLTDGEDNRINATNIYFSEDKEGHQNSREKYIEYIFEIQETELENYHVGGTFVENDNFIKGKWENTFKVKAVEQSKQINCSIDIGNATINSVSLSPLGITLLGKGSHEGLKDINISVIMRDDRDRGSVEGVIRHSDNDGFKIKYIPNKVFDMEHIKGVSINGDVVVFN